MKSWGEIYNELIEAPLSEYQITKIEARLIDIEKVIKREFNGDSNQVFLIYYESIEEWQEYSAIGKKMTSLLIEKITEAGWEIESPRSGSSHYRLKRKL